MRFYVWLQLDMCAFELVASRSPASNRLGSVRLNIWSMDLWKKLFFSPLAWSISHSFVLLPCQMNQNGALPQLPPDPARVGEWCVLCLAPHFDISGGNLWRKDHSQRRARRYYDSVHCIKISRKILRNLRLNLKRLREWLLFQNFAEVITDNEKTTTEVMMMKKRSNAEQNIMKTKKSHENIFILLLT